MDKLNSSVTGGRAAPIAMLGVPFDNVTTAETVELIEQMIRSRRSHYLATANVDFLVQAAGDVELRRILFDAHLVLCDGTPLVWASKLLGNSLPERVAGSDLVPLLLRVAAERGYRPFFLGATPETIETAVANVRLRHPTLEIAGYYSPPFNRLLEMDHDAIRNKIIEARPDLLFVGFGCPKQEKWIYMHYRSLGVPVCVGVGGTIDFLAGKLDRAPVWMQRIGTEWIYRLAQEPRRLLGRYARDLVHFGGGMAAQCWRMRSRGKPRRAPTNTVAAESVPAETHFTLAHLPARLDCEAVHEHTARLDALAAEPKPLVLEASAVEFLDSTGVGLLIRLQKRARLNGQPMLLARPSAQVTRALRWMQLEHFFESVSDSAQAAARLRNRAGGSAVRLQPASGGTPSALAWRGELTAANADEIWTSTMEQIAARSMVQRSLAIDLAHLRFIDSTGLGVMIRAKKFGKLQNVEISFQNPTDNVRNVLRLSRLEAFLSEGGK